MTYSLFSRTLSFALLGALAATSTAACDRGEGSGEGPGAPAGAATPAGDPTTAAPEQGAAPERGAAPEQGAAPSEGGGAVATPASKPSTVPVAVPAGFADKTFGGRGAAIFEYQVGIGSEI